MVIRRQERLDLIFRALGDQSRRRMLALLARNGEQSAGELGKPLEMSQPSVSKHIGVLEKAGLVARRVDGRVHRFQLLHQRLDEALSWIETHKRLWEHSLDALGEVLDQLGESE